MTTALVQIIGLQPLPNIFDIVALRPARIISLHTERTLQVAERIRKFSAKLLPDCEHVLCENATLLNTQIALAKQQGMQIIGNLSGGFKLQSFFTQFQLKGKYPAFYIDQTGNKFIDALSVNKHPLIEQLQNTNIDELKASISSLELLALFDDEVAAKPSQPLRLQQLRQLAQNLHGKQELAEAFNALCAENTPTKHACKEFLQMYQTLALQPVYEQADKLLKDCNLALIVEELLVEFTGAELLFDIAKHDIILRHAGEFYAVALEDICQEKKRLVPNLLKFSTQIQPISGLGCKAIYYTRSSFITKEILQLAKNKGIELKQPSLKPGCRKKVLVQTIGFEVLPNLFDVLRLQPDIVIHLVSPQSKEHSSNLFHALKQHCKAQFKQLEFADTGDIAGFRQLIEQELARFSKPWYDCFFNLSGGTKALSSQLLFYAINNKHNILGINTDSSYYTFNNIDQGFAASEQLQTSWLVERLGQAVSNEPKQLLKILLNAHGVRLLEDNSSINEAEIYQHPEFLTLKNHLHKIMHDNKADFNNELGAKNLLCLKRYYALVDLLCERGIFEQVEPETQTYRIAKAQDAQQISLMLVGGGHWEYRVRQALANTDRLQKRGIIKQSITANVKWGTKEKSARMEEDLLALDSNYNLLNISCKTNLHTPQQLGEHIMEHASRCKQLGGTRALGAIACRKWKAFCSDDLVEAGELANSFGVILLKLIEDPRGDYLMELDPVKMRQYPAAQSE